MQTLEMDLSEGRLNLDSTVRLTPGPMELFVQRGSAARQVRISPEMCAGALMYVAPVLAGVAAAFNALGGAVGGKVASRFFAPST